MVYGNIFTCFDIAARRSYVMSVSITFICVYANMPSSQIMSDSSAEDIDKSGLDQINTRRHADNLLALRDRVLRTLIQALL